MLLVPYDATFRKDPYLAEPRDLSLLAQTGEQIVALRDFNERINQANRLLTMQGLTTDTAASGACRYYAKNLRVAFIPETLI